MFTTVAKTVFVLWLGVCLALGQTVAATFAAAACAVEPSADCECGSCAPGCKCCVQSGAEDSTPAPAPANAPTLHHELLGAIFYPAFKLAPQTTAAVSALAADSSFAFVSTVPIFTRDCSYLI